MKRLLVLPVAVLFSTACAASPDTAADRQAIAAALSQTQAAENAGSVEQMRPYFSDDIVMMAPNAPAVVGAESVMVAMRGFFNAFAVAIRYSSSEIVVSGDWAFDRGTFRQTLTPKSGGPALADSGKYLWVYRRDSDGKWRQTRVAWNSDMPPVAASP